MPVRSEMRRTPATYFCVLMMRSTYFFVNRFLPAKASFRGCPGLISAYLRFSCGVPGGVVSMKRCLTSRVGVRTVSSTTLALYRLRASRIGTLLRVAICLTRAQYFLALRESFRRVCSGVAYCLVFLRGFDMLLGIEYASRRFRVPAPARWQPSGAVVILSPGAYPGRVVSSGREWINPQVQRVRKNPLCYPRRSQHRHRD